MGPRRPARRPGIRPSTVPAATETRTTTMASVTGWPSLLLDLAHVAHGAPSGARGHRRVSAEGLSPDPLASRLPGVLALRFHGRAPRRQRRVVHGEVDATLGDVDLDRVAFLDQADGSSFGRLGGGMTDAEPAGAAAEAAVGEERAGLAQVLALREGRRIEHLLHARAALGALVDDHDDVSGLDAVRQDRLAGRVLGVEDARAALEDEDRLVDARRLHDAAVLGDVPVEDREPAVLAVGVLLLADAAGLAVEIRVRVVLVLAEGDVRAHATGGGERSLLGGGRGRGASDVVLVDGRAEGRAMDGGHVASDQASAIEGAQDREDAAGPMHVFDVIL